MYIYIAVFSTFKLLLAYDVVERYLHLMTLGCFFLGAREECPLFSLDDNRNHVFVLKVIEINDYIVLIT